MNILKSYNKEQNIKLNIIEIRKEVICQLACLPVHPSTQVVPLHVCYMVWSFLRPSSGMSMQKSYKGKYNEIKFKVLLVDSHCFLTV